MTKPHGTLFPYIVSVYVTALILRPILAFKIISIGGLTFPGALFIFPLSFVCNDIFSEVYGYEKSRSVVWAGLICQVLASLVIVLVTIAPSPDFWTHQDAFQLVLGQSFRITTASMLGCFLGEITNSMIISKMKFAQKGALGKAQSTRFVVSTIFGEFVDSLIFITFAFAGTYSIEKILTLVATTWVLKTLYEIIFLPLTTRVAQIIKKTEHIDVIDDPNDTNYSLTGLGT
jgi:uncharacterized integral membrane protein (TIGR00697 family)